MGDNSGLFFIFISVAHLNLGILYANKGKYEEAEKVVLFVYKVLILKQYKLLRIFIGVKVWSKDSVETYIEDQKIWANFAEFFFRLINN